MAGRLDGRVALVSGASSGIGASTATALAAEGALVAGAARRTDRLDRLREEVAAAGGRLLPVELDVDDEAACRAAVDRVREELGGLDLVVSNAGLALPGPIADADTDDWRRMMQTNVLGAMYLTSAALPHLLAQGSGQVVTVSSISGRRVGHQNGVYAASKAAINAFCESLRQEVTARGIRVTVVEPGLVDTEIDQQVRDPEARRRAQERTASIRKLQPEDIAAAVVYAVTQPDHVSVNEVLVRPVDQTK